LRSVPNRTDYDAFALHAVQHDVRSASDYQFPDARFRADPAQVGMVFQSFHDADNAYRKLFRSFRFISRNVSVNFQQSRSRQCGPYDLY
jgi:hypothetical protein